MSETYDVIIVGGGPAGTTAGTLLKKYSPDLRVLILEREKFPREHVGESQLPVIGRVLYEMGVWDKIEAAGFLIKFGASYTWGRTREPWVFGFIPDEEVRDDPRPAPFEGWRQRVALQVDREVYDEILLRHAEETGCEVREETPVTKVLRSGDRIDGLVLKNGEEVSARYYVDASGNAGILRKAMEVKVEVPTLLQNVAFWDYFEKPGMNVPVLERGSIRVRIRSVPFGWIWYIALSDSRTSVGLVTPAKYFKECGKRPEELFNEALKMPEDLQDLLAGASSTGEIRRTTDWSFVAERTFGENWYLCGESLGFADPILAAGMTLTHTSARHLAYTILERERGELEQDWLNTQYDEVQRKRVIQHMRFAEYWYSGNGEFSAIQEHCADIARNAGLELNPNDAFRWLSNGGVDDEIGQVAVGGLNLAGIKGVQWRLKHEQGQDISYEIDGKSRFKLKTSGAEEISVASLEAGRIKKVPALERDGERLVLSGAYALAYDALKAHNNAADIFRFIREEGAVRFGKENEKLAFQETMQCLEMMVARGWAAAYYKHGQAAISMKAPEEGEIIYSEAEKARRKEVAAKRSK